MILTELIKFRECESTPSRCFVKSLHSGKIFFFINDSINARQKLKFYCTTSTSFVDLQIIPPAVIHELLAVAVEVFIRVARFLAVYFYATM